MTAYKIAIKYVSNLPCRDSFIVIYAMASPWTGSTMLADTQHTILAVKRAVCEVTSVLLLRQLRSAGVRRRSVRSAVQFDLTVGCVQSLPVAVVGQARVDIC